jgi:predicted hydrocarbon binding protein
VNCLSKWIGKKIAKRFAPMIKQMYLTMGALSKAFYKKYGKDALPIITEVMGESGVEEAKIAQRMLKGKGMNAVRELFGMMEMMDMQVEIIDFSDDMIRVKEAVCPMGLEGTSKELCEAMMTSNEKMVSTLLGKEVEMKILKSMAAGDEYCDGKFIITKK